IKAAPTFSWEEDEPVDVESKSEEFTGGDTKEETMGEGVGGEASGMAEEYD
ncbi:hypothetical protein KI387_036056, partial [Taxus chinensis]